MRQDMAGERDAQPGATVAVAAADASAQPARAVSVAPSRRLGYVDGLRALAALYVVVSHMVPTVWRGNDPPPGLSSMLGSPFAYGHFAVSVFIVLSGFSLMLPVARRGNTLPWGVWGFYWRRARRILPPYYLAMAFSLLLIWLFIGQKTGTHWDVALPATGRAVIEHVLLIQNLSFTDHATINYVFWSIAMECQIYLFFPLFVLLWRRYPPLFATIALVGVSLALLFWLALTWVGRLPFYAGFSFVPQYFGLFAIGMCAASAYTTQTPRWLRLRDWYVWELVALVCFVVLAATVITWPIYILDLLAATGTVGLLFAASRPGPRNPVRAALDWRPLVWVGGFSYSVYLIHAPLIQLLWQYGLRPLGFGLGMLPTYLALVVTGVPLIVATSWGFWYVCERPFLNSRPAGWRALRTALRYRD
ncbi:MAG TPA: acyltransferase [Ktedonobacterales bacterium]|jgi:peptidoglycan/LPS O-acetylase OafA/YrhL|nr:acyltransferase [Ktedonobacterales bacterium]